MRKLAFPFFALILIFILVYIILRGILEIFNGSELVKPQLLGVTQTVSNLSKVIDESLIGTKGIYSVVIKNLSNGESYYLNEKKVYDAASLYKLWVMGAVFEKIAEGKLAENKTLRGDVAELNTYFGIDEEEAEFTEGAFTFTVSSALNQMITISHNYAALILSREIGREAIVEFMKKSGLSSSEYGSPPKTTAEDTALFFKKIYKGEIISKEYSDKMIEILKDQKKNEGLPKLLPEETLVAHKTGELGWVKHDGGIVYTPNGDYIIVVLSETSAPLAAQEKIAQLSKAVYEYFTK